MPGINNSKTTAIVVTFILVCIVSLPSMATIQLRMQTDLGGIDIELFDAGAPQTVANFLNYVNRGDYDRTFIHRNVSGFVLQMGGYSFNLDDGEFFSPGRQFGNLDNQNGGFTVFADVTGNGMDTIDEIVGKIRCSDYFVFNQGQCNRIISFSDMPLLHMVVDSSECAGRNASKR